MLIIILGMDNRAQTIQELLVEAINQYLDTKDYYIDRSVCWKEIVTIVTISLSSDIELIKERLFKSFHYVAKY